MPLSGWLQIALDFVFPAECVGCHEFLGDDRVLLFCRSCWNAIRPITAPACPQCGRPQLAVNVGGQAPPGICRKCRQTPPFYDRAIAAAYYEGVLQEAIHQFKFKQKTGLGQPLAQLMLAHLPPDLDLRQYQAILPIPLHKTRQRQRGYNQSSMLAKYLAQHFRIALVVDNLRRIRATTPQWQTKGRKERQENVKNAFRLDHPTTLQNKAVILIDDVMTSGATFNECAKTLKQAGVTSVLVLALSRPAQKTSAAQ